VKWREEKHWSAAKLAEEAGVAPGTLSGLETGKRIPLPKNVDKILAALGKTQFDLLRDDEDTPSIKRTDPLVAGLRLEDFQIARLWSRAGLDVKNSIKRMLEADRDRALQELFMAPTEGFVDRRTGTDRRHEASEHVQGDLAQVLGELFNFKLTETTRESFLRVLEIIRTSPEVLPDIEVYAKAWDQADEPARDPAAPVAPKRRRDKTS
jgi:transcriptional regulator with XRE-family HTH domain